MFCHRAEPSRTLLYDFHFYILGTLYFIFPSDSSFDSQIYNLCASRSYAYFTFVFFSSFYVDSFETGFMFSIHSVYLVFGFTYWTQHRESLTHVYSERRKRKSNQNNIHYERMKETYKTPEFIFIEFLRSHFVFVESFGHYIYWFQEFQLSHSQPNSIIWIIDWKSNGEYKIYRIQTHFR